MADVPNQEPAHTVEDAAAKILSLTTPDQEEVIEESAEATPEETTEEIVEETEESEVEASEEDEAEETEEPDDELTEVKEWLIESKDKYDDLQVMTKFNGTETPVPISELVKSYQLNQNAEHRADSLKVEREEFKSEKEKILAETNQQLNHASELVSVLEQSFLADFNKVNWEELRENDPGEFSAKRQDLLERQQGIQSIKAGIGGKQREIFKKEFEAKIRAEQKRLPEVIPEWSDSKVASTESKEIRDYLLSQGLTPDEIDGATDAQGNIVSLGIVDSRAIMLARKAMLFDKGQKKVEVAKKKVRNVPKVIKAGKPREKAEINAEKSAKQFSRLKKTGKLDDAASLLMERMFGG